MILDQFYQFCSIIIGLLCFWGLLPPIYHRGEGSHQFLRPRVAGALKQFKLVHRNEKLQGSDNFAKADNFATHQSRVMKIAQVQLHVYRSTMYKFQLSTLKSVGVFCSTNICMQTNTLCCACVGWGCGYKKVTKKCQMRVCHLAFINQC